MASRRRPRQVDEVAQSSRTSDGAVFAAPSVSSAVVAAFAEVLGVDADGETDFFRLGGTSLQMVTLLQHVEQCLGVTLRATAVMLHPTPSRLADAIRTGIALDDTRSAAVDLQAGMLRAAPSRASFVQEAILALAPQSASRGFLTWVYQLNGPLDRSALSAAVDDVVLKHDVLRTRFERIEGELHVDVVPFTPGRLQRVSFEHLPKAEALTAAVEDAARQYRALSPDHDPMLHTTLYEIDRKTSVLAAFVGEALVDSDSATILASEISAAYAARAGTPVPPGAGPGTTAASGSGMPPPPSRACVEQARKHWSAQAMRHTSLGAWPLAGASSPATLEFSLEEGEWAGVVRRAQSFGATPYVYLLACLQMAFAEAAHTRRFLVNAAVVNRRRPGSAHMIGAFQVPVRIETDLSSCANLVAAVAQAKVALRIALEHCDIPPPVVDRESGRTEPVPAVTFQMFRSHVGPLFTGVRRRRFRFHGDLHCEPLLAKAVVDKNGRQSFVVSSATASRGDVEDFTRSFREFVLAVPR